MRSSAYSRPLSDKQASESRDALSKTLYARLFGHLIASLNRLLGANPTGRTISILDIFGFEIFERNSFEQFCINWANEKLQGYFNQQIFSYEQAEYQREGIHRTKPRYSLPTGLLPRQQRPAQPP